MRRSIVATATFFFTAVATTRLAYGNSLPPVGLADWTLGPHGTTFLTLQALPFAISTLVYLVVRKIFFVSYSPAPQSLFRKAPGTSASTQVEDTSKAASSEPRSLLRLVVNFATAVNFAIALRFSNLSDPKRIISFLLLPFQRAFDPSLAFLAAGAMPPAILLYHFGRGKEQPRLGGRWSVPKGGKIDSRLLLGAAIFGVGWGMGGVCRKFFPLCLFWIRFIRILIDIIKYIKMLSGSWPGQSRASAIQWFRYQTDRHLGRFCCPWRLPCIGFQLCKVKSICTRVSSFVLRVSPDFRVRDSTLAGSELLILTQDYARNSNPPTHSWLRLCLRSQPQVLISASSHPRSSTMTMILGDVIGFSAVDTVCLARLSRRTKA